MMNHNLFCGYQQYVEYHWQTFPSATPQLYQEWNVTFYGSITPSSMSSLSINKYLMSLPSSTNNNSIMSRPSTSKNVEREREGKAMKAPRLIQIK